MAVAQGFKAKDPLVYVATVEGANGFDAVLPQIKQAGVKTCHLAPLMVVAGDHANNDLAGGEDDSWASLIKKEGMTPVPHLVGLGQNPAVRAVYLRHTKDAKDDLAHPKKSD
ncbi:MAG: sirohydrochlorin cobaltochelatase, partial [Desulfovibrio sp.]|nr:sirohydrochlorin cobaltochelatase [Desulfovibrio sp.]